MVSNKGAIMAVSYTQYREDKISFGTHYYIDSEFYFFHCMHWDVNHFHLFCRSGAVQ